MSQESPPPPPSLYWLPTNSSPKESSYLQLKIFWPLDEYTYLAIASFPGCFSPITQPGTANPGSKECRFEKVVHGFVDSHVQ